MTHFPVGAALSGDRSSGKDRRRRRWQNATASAAISSVLVPAVALCSSVHPVPVARAQEDAADSLVRLPLRYGPPLADATYPEIRRKLGKAKSGGDGKADDAAGRNAAEADEERGGEAEQPQTPAAPEEHHHHQQHTNQQEDDGTDPYGDDKAGMVSREGDGTHFVELFVGNPAQKLTLAVVTGSHLTAFPCEDCTDCGDAFANPYNHTLSDTFSEIPCGECVSGTGDDELCNDDGSRCLVAAKNPIDFSSWKAYEARDHVYIGGADLGGQDPTGSDAPKVHGFPLAFGCQTKARGWYANDVQDGIMGFSSARTSFINQMVDAGELPRPRFSICFNIKSEMEEDPLSSLPKSAGVVTLGGYDPTFLDTPMSYAQNVSPDDDPTYKVFISGMYLREGGGRSIRPVKKGQKWQRIGLDAETFNADGAVVDSGTPFLLLDESVEKAFRRAWKKTTGHDFTYAKLVLDQETLDAMPTLILQLKAHSGVDKSIDPNSVPNMAGDLNPSSPYDVLIAIPAAHYMEYNAHSNTYRTRITLQNKGGSVLGANMMQGHNILYDLQGKRFGIAEAAMCERKPTEHAMDDDLFDSLSSQNILALEDLADLYGTTSGSPDESGDKSSSSKGLSGSGKAGTLPDLGKNEDTSAVLSMDEKDTKVKGKGTCETATCKSFVGVGYMFVLIALVVAYKISRPKDRSVHWDDLYNDDDELEPLHNDNAVFDADNPEIRQYMQQSARGFV